LKEFNVSLLSDGPKNLLYVSKGIVKKKRKEFSAGLYVVLMNESELCILGFGVLTIHLKSNFGK
jgi:hypothetical protein